MKLSKKIALSGMITAVSIVFMFLTGVFPFATLALPGIAGVLLVVPVIEIGRKEALLIYAAVSLLSFFAVPDREAAVCYVIFLGYYPIIKSKLEQFRSRVTEYICKIGLFTVVAIAATVVLVFIFGLEQLELTPALLAGGYLLLLFAFVLYDFAVSQIVQFYIKRLRSVLSKRFFN